MVVWGDVHAHSNLSEDASGDPHDFFRIARDVINLDFVVLSDHDIYLTAQEWRTLKETANAFDEPGRFAAFAGVEWTHAWHMNFYFRGDGGEICGGGGGPPCSDAAAARSFYAPRVLADDAASHINHPHPLSTVNWYHVWDDVATNVEMWNSMWSFHIGPDTPALWFGGPLWALQVGFRFGFVGVSDDHFVGRQDFYLLGTGLTGCHVEELTRSAVIDALRKRRCYASIFRRVLLDFQVDDVPMGGDLTVPLGSTVTANVSVVAPAKPTLIELLWNGRVAARKEDCASGTCAFSAPLAVTDEYNFVFAKVYDGETFRTWSTPVWIHGACTAPDDCPRERMLPAAGDPSASCLAAWRVLPAADRDAGGNRRRRLTCANGDPSCDFDFDPAGCTFHVGVCFGVEENRRASCQGAPLRSFDLSARAPRSARRSVTDIRNLRTLTATAQALRSAQSPGRCSPYVPVHVPLRQLSNGTVGRSARTFVLRSEVDGRRDVDRLSLVCLPSAG